MSNTSGREMWTSINDLKKKKCKSIIILLRCIQSVIISTFDNKYFILMDRSGFILSLVCYLGGNNFGKWWGKNDVFNCSKNMVFTFDSWWLVDEAKFGRWIEWYYVFTPCWITDSDNLQETRKMLWSQFLTVWLVLATKPLLSWQNTHCTFHQLEWQNLHPSLQRNLW